ncbi:MAG: hypothetical protein RIB60_00615 [Phycisphaerales bacterium]
MTMARSVSALGITALVLAAGGCSLNTQTAASRSVEVPQQAAPPFELLTEEGVVQEQVFDLTEPGAVAWGTADVEIIDTRAFPQQIQDVSSIDGQKRGTKVILPPHQRPVMDAPVGENDLRPDGELLRVPRASLLSSFTALNSTGWVPPDPALAVGPNHVVVSVNQSLAFYTKAGTLQFQAILGSQGSPGFFETVGAGNFAFDPKCFYDHYADRFVVLALEVYSTTAYVTIAVSDDSDPNGTWYKYRTDAVTTIGSSTYWWDYPGLSFDQDAYYVTSNLFILQGGGNGFGGAGYRVFDKAPLLSGAPAVFSTLRDGGSASVQACQHFGNNPAPYFASEGPGATMRLQAITNPLTTPTLVTTDVTIPSYSGAFDAPVNGGGAISTVGSRIMNCAWRNDKAYVAHTVGGGTNNARWYEFDMNNWPFGGTPTNTQVGQINMGSGIHSFFPAIYPNDDGSLGLVFGSSSPSDRVSMYVTGRNTDDAPGVMGDPVLVRTGNLNGTSGRWGDYYDIAVDPTDGTTFWAIGQTDESSAGGWDPWVAQFTVVPGSVCAGDCDGNGTINVDDIDCFVAGFLAGDLGTSDCDGNGALNVDDVDCFVAAFLAGCP